MTLDTLARPPSLVEKVCQTLATLARGEPDEANGWLPTERELASQLGVSRSVVREAIKRLEQQGLLEIRQGLGTRTVNRLHKPLSDSLHLLVPNEAERLRQLFEVRLMVEPCNASLAAERASAAQIDALAATHDRLIAAPTTADSVAADMAFHRQLAEASGNQIADLLLHSLSDLLEASLKVGYGRVAPERAIAEHTAILDAIQRRDPAAAAAATQSHLLTARADLGLPN